MSHSDYEPTSPSYSPTHPSYSPVHSYNSKNSQQDRYGYSQEQELAKLKKDLERERYSNAEMCERLRDLYERLAVKDAEIIRLMHPLKDLTPEQQFELEKMKLQNEAKELAIRENVVNLETMSFTHKKRKETPSPL